MPKSEAPTKDKTETAEVDYHALAEKICRKLWLSGLATDDRRNVIMIESLLRESFSCLTTAPK